MAKLVALTNCKVVDLKQALKLASPDLLSSHEHRCEREIKTRLLSFRVACPMIKHHPMIEHPKESRGGGLANKDCPIGVHMLSYHRTLGDEKLRLAFFIVSSN